MSQTAKGLILVVLAYGAWGLSPLFWKQLVAVPAELQLAHRIVWAAVLMAVLVGGTGRLREVTAALRSRRTVLALLASAALIATNWGTYLYAVVSNRLVEASLGYYLNPLVSVALGAIVLREPLTRRQVGALALAALGVAVLAYRVGHLPWLSIVLSGAFAFYGLVRKTMDVAALPGSLAEALFLAVPSLAFVVMAEAPGDGPFLGPDGLPVWLVLTGPMTALPLVAFSSAARKLTLGTIGILQFITPTSQLLLATLVYDEPFSDEHALAFGAIWSGVILWAWDLRQRTRAA